MKPLQFIAVKLSLCLILGILIGHYISFSILQAFSVIILLLCLTIFAFLKAKRNSISFGFFAALLIISIGIFTITSSNPKKAATHYCHNNTIHTSQYQIKITEVLKSNTFSNRYIGKIKTVDGQYVTGKLLLTVKKDTTLPKFTMDDELIAYSKVTIINQPLNPHQFNYADYMNGLGIYHQLQLSANNFFLKNNSNKTLIGIAASTRNTIIEKLKKANFGKEELGVIEALLLGQRQHISEETYDNYKNAGAVHILALSGLHIGILLLLLQFLLQPLELLPKGKTIKLVTIVCLLWSFAFLAGMSSSIIRAVTMFSFVAYALYLNRPTSTFNIIALSLFFILLINPGLLFQAGFQMSYAAVFTIVWVYPMAQRLWFPKLFLVRKIWQLFSISVAAQLGVLPISLFYFHQFPSLFFISNLLIVPFLGIILGYGIFVIILALFNILPHTIAQGYNTIIQIMNKLVAWVAKQEAFLFKNISFDGVQLILTYILILTFIIFLTRRTYKKAVWFLCSIVCLQLWSTYKKYNTNQTEKLIVAHQTRNSILLYQNGDSLNVLSSKTASTERIATDFAVANSISFTKYKPLLNSYTLANGSSLYITDSLGVIPNQSPTYLLLAESPKINLERLLDSIQPKVILADGSNYKTTIARWKASCKKRKIPFHYTGEKGFYEFQ